jgi:hypothetical protein
MTIQVSELNGRFVELRPQTDAEIIFLFKLNSNQWAPHGAFRFSTAPDDLFDPIAAATGAGFVCVMR